MVRLIKALTLTGMLLGCADDSVVREKVFQGDFLLYQCESQQTFQVAFMPNTPAALLRTEQGDYRLMQVRSGSGSKYILDDKTTETPNPITLYTKGQQARLEVGRMTYKNCLTQ
ncbi:MliC family protein [Vibrio sp. JPW-9-11-11]|uniref:MliC family protein n=1 Tax=Vibrio sp. JPW-9-11-11 TaxID=1416532 RepID=UPI0020CBF678|nr:MliC family protein [Vibrio sp. JPW-9-11-11]